MSIYGVDALFVRYKVILLGGGWAGNLLKFIFLVWEKKRNGVDGLTERVGSGKGGRGDDVCLIRNELVGRA